MPRTTPEQAVSAINPIQANRLALIKRLQAALQAGILNNLDADIRYQTAEIKTHYNKAVELKKLRATLAKPAAAATVSLAQIRSTMHCHHNEVTTLATAIGFLKTMTTEEVLISPTNGGYKTQTYDTTIYSAIEAASKLGF